jgi:hypothetical protein
MEAALPQIQGWAAEPDALVTRIAPRFTSRESVTASGRSCAGCSARSSASTAGSSPSRPASAPRRDAALLNHARWDADAVRDDVRARVSSTRVRPVGAGGGRDRLGQEGTKSAGVQRQDTGTVGRKENCQVGVLLADASTRGAALVTGSRPCPSAGPQPGHAASRPPSLTRSGSRPSRSWPACCWSARWMLASRLPGSPAMRPTAATPACGGGWRRARAARAGGHAHQHAIAMPLLPTQPRPGSPPSTRTPGRP